MGHARPLDHAHGRRPGRAGHARHPRPSQERLLPDVLARQGLRPVRCQSFGNENLQQREGGAELPARTGSVYHVSAPRPDPLRHREPATDRDVLPGLREVRRPGYRWTVCALLFVVTTVNYIDRQVLGILAPTLQRELHWSETGYGDVVSWFTALYAVGFLVVGRWLDRVGVRRGFAVAVVAWSVAAIGHAVARTTAGFSAARALLGLGESANFPGAIKAVAEWFPDKERALATGIFNAGTNTGAIVAPLVVPWIALTFGWRWAFIATGCLGFLWLALWLALYRAPEAHPRLSAAELAYIRVGAPVVGHISWLRLL